MGRRLSTRRNFGGRSYGCRRFPMLLPMLYLFSFILLGRRCMPDSRDQHVIFDASPGGARRHLLQTNATLAGGESKIAVVVADGGASYIYPTMTVRAYESAIEQGADYVLCKIYVTSDGQAVCRPFLDLAKSTNVGSGPAPVYNYTLASVKRFRAKQTGAGKRTAAFDDILEISTPFDILDVVNKRSRADSVKPVGILFELPPLAEVAGQPDSNQPTSVLMRMLMDIKWTSMSSPPMVTSTDLAALQAVKTAMAVPLLLKIAGPDSGSQNKTAASDLSSEALKGIASVASGIMLPTSLVITQEEYKLLGSSLNRSRWDNATILAARAAGLSVYIHGFNENDWSVSGPPFNGFLGDTLAMYRSLLYDPHLLNLVSGILTQWPATAATAAACYKAPVALQQESSKGLPTGRPIIMSSGGSQALTPSQTNLSYLRAVAEGADFIDCNVQVSADNVLFCHSDVKLIARTNVESVRALDSTMKTHPEEDGTLTTNYWAFDLTWEQIQRLRVKQSSTSRAQTFHLTVPPPSLTEVFSIARSAGRTVGMFIKMEDPTHVARVTSPPKNVPDLVLAFLRNESYISADNVYDPQGGPPLLVGSFDQCGLQALYNASRGTIPLLQKFSGGKWGEPCEKQTKPNNVHPSEWWTSPEGLDHIKTYAIGINPPRALIIGNVRGQKSDANAAQAPKDIAEGFLDPNTLSTLVADAKARGLKVYPKVFQNDNIPGDDNQGAYDYLDDPTLEIQYYYDQLNVDAIEAQFPATVALHLESACRGGNGVGGFKPFVVTPGKLYREAKTGMSEAAAEEGVSKKGRHLSRGGRVGVIVAACILPLLAASAAVLLCLWRRRAIRKDKETAVSLRMEGLEKHPQLKIFSYAELASATGNFSEGNRLGKGAFGTVFKGTFADGTLVAVKSLGFTDSRSKREESAVRQLKNELAIIGTVHNRNVVTLQGYSIDREWLLVYDFMPNGSLQDALFNPEYPIQLDWGQWFNIMLGTAKGIAYLHEECEHKIIHRDIKPANILLDSQLNARVADFGLARNTRVEETHVTTQVMGTIGYLAPEYAASGQLTEKSDVYSYGVVMIIVITGSPLIDMKGSAHRERGSMALEWVQEKAEKGDEELLTVISPKFEGKYNVDEAQRWLHIALLCVQSTPAQRPSMGEVVQMLLGNRPIPEIEITRTQLVHKRSGSSYHGGTSTSGLSHQTYTSSSQGDESTVNLEMTQLEGR